MADDTSTQAEGLATRTVVLSLLATEMERRPNLREELARTLDRVLNARPVDDDVAVAARAKLHALVNEAEETMMPPLPPWPEETVPKERLWRRVLRRLKRILRRNRARLRP